MSVQRKRTETIYAIFRELVDGGRDSVRPGDINTVLRDRGQPMGTWEVRRELSRLEDEGLISCDAATTEWHLTEKGASMQKAG